MGFEVPDVDWSRWPDWLSSIYDSIEELGYANIFGGLASVYVSYRAIYALCLSPLRRVPGPLLARLTSKRAELIGAAGGQVRAARADYEKYGDIYVYKPGAVAICNPEDLRLVLGSHEFRKTDFYKSIDFLGVQTIVSARDPKLASMKRRQVGPYFNSSYLARMEETIMKQGIHSIKEKWDKLISESNDGKAEVEASRDLLFATFDTIGALSFGREFGALKNNDNTAPRWIASTVKYFAGYSMSPLLRMPPFSLLLKPWERQYKELTAYSAQCVAERRELLARLDKDTPESKRPADLLQGFIDAEDPESKIRMTPVEVHAESMLMMVLGSKTSSFTILWTIHLLTLYPEHYRRAVEEVRSAFGKDHVITYSEGRRTLPFVEACIYESMRVAPVAGGMWPRLAPKGGVTLSGYFIPAGTEINVNIAAANLNKGYWTEPYLFNPLRFIDNEEAKRNVFTFSGGVRICPGRHLAWIEMVTILANILKDYDLRLPEDLVHLGPGVLDERGHPRLMESKHYFSSNPTNPERDCRLVISKSTWQTG
ncbi:cytochrome P450 [Martensiomyces pterosporus]|nr:cytochrome P450 [Martensiomyces pterosporus]